MLTTAPITKRFASCNRILLACFLSYGGALAAQSTDSIPGTEKTTLLPTATIRDTRFFQTGYALRNTDSLPVAAILLLSDKLRWQNAIDVRANAPGTLATLSIRGAGAARTPVFWNGINLQSPMNGVVDAALLPVWPEDDVSLQFGGQSAAQSSGAMGGSVYITQGVKPAETGWLGETWLEAGSFGYQNARAGITFSDEQYCGQIRGSFRRADYDFFYPAKGLDGKTYQVRQVNNALESGDLQVFNQVKIKEKSHFKSAYWLQNTFRQIPPATTEAPKQSWQRDRSNRALASWENAPSRRTLWTTRLAWLDDFLAFHLSGDTDTSRSRQLLLFSDLSGSTGSRLSWRTGVQAIRQWAQADGYADSVRWFEQTRLAGYGMAEWRRKKWRFSLLLRQEWAENQAAPFTWSAGGVMKAGRGGEIRFHASRNFNLPTFNDRFWQALGNPDLRPEKGWSADIGWLKKTKRYNFELALFQLLLDDWILWQPDSSGLFRPDNLRKVWSRGLELNAGYAFHTGHWHWQASARAQCSATTLVAVYGGTSRLIGSQLPYTPRFSGGLHLSLRRGLFSASYAQQFTGTRLDNNAQVLAGFNTGHFFAACELWKGRLLLNVRIENIWNTRYEIIRHRPMPGISGSAGVLVRLYRK
jgi:iron complex outermembrane receptor protein